jgi:hypothetical protein
VTKLRRPAAGRFRPSPIGGTAVPVVGRSLPVSPGRPRVTSGAVVLHARKAGVAGSGVLLFGGILLFYRWKGLRMSLAVAAFPSRGRLSSSSESRKRE